MKVQLLYEDRPFPWNRTPELWEGALVQDLELDKLLEAMAGAEKNRRSNCRQVLLTPVQREDEQRYRQEILQDFLAQPWILQTLRQLLDRLREREKAIHQIGLIMEYPTSLTGYGRDRLEVQLEELQALRNLAEQMDPCVRAPGLRAFVQRIFAELTDDFFEEAGRQLQNCRFKAGIRTAVTLGPGLKPTGFVPEEPDGSGFALLRKKLADRTPHYTFGISEDDSSGMKALSELEQKSLNAIGNVLMQTASHVDRFFDELDRELMFYEGAVRLRGQLEALGCSTAFPTVGLWQYDGLYDGALSLQKKEPVVGNTHSPGTRGCVLITGANQGGKTTFLRSVGQAILMAQAGLFVCARAFQCPLYDHLFTHFRREEDRTMHSGKLDEELQRMDALVDAMTVHSCLLMNESFAATNEEDGSEIAWQVMKALLDQGVQIFCVTHFYELASRFLTERKADTLFLQAIRRPDGSRSFALLEGRPAPTGHGRDLYKTVFKTPHDC